VLASASRLINYLALKVGFIDAEFYLKDNPDVAAAGVNPVWHYLRRGRIEGRKPLARSPRQNPPGAAKLGIATADLPEISITRGESEFADKNRWYDHLTQRIIQQELRRNSVCVDAGCHAGDILRLMIRSAPDGTFYAFEPLPHLYRQLRARFPHPQVKIFDIALSNKKGSASFNYVVSNPGYSGLLRRHYDNPNEKDSQIVVQTDLLDNIIPATESVDLIKIDVEGAELQVLQGAIRTIKRTKPLVIFEHGLGASDCYGTNPEQVYSFLCDECGLKISLLNDFLEHRQALSLGAFCEQFHEARNYYFLAHPA
jgi:FkbM family methyltransferase